MSGRTPRQSSRPSLPSLRKSINGVEGMRYMTSISGNDGSSQISVVFELTRPLDIAAVDVQNRVSSVNGRLPNEVKNTGVTVTKVASSFIGAVGFYSDGNRYTTQFMSNYVDIYVKNALKRIHGVADVQIFGERKYSMRLWLDPSQVSGTWIDRFGCGIGLTATKYSDCRRTSGAGTRSQGPDVSNQRARGRPIDGGTPVRRHHPEAGRQWRAGAGERCWARGTRCRKLRRKAPV